MIWRTFSGTHNSKWSACVARYAIAYLYRRPAYSNMVQYGTHNTTKPHPLINIKNNEILMPGDTTDIPVNLPDQQVIIEAFRANQWPTHQLAIIKNGSFTLYNNTKKPILMSAKKVTTIKITPTTLTDVRALPIQPGLNAVKSPDKLTDTETIGLIDCTRAEPKVKHILNAAHTQFCRVFDKDLTGGYNGHFSQHICRLNWSSLLRPTAK